MVQLSPDHYSEHLRRFPVEKLVHISFITWDNFELWISLCASLRKSREKRVGNAGKPGGRIGAMWKTLWTRQ
jgi:hypothetical protein